MPAYFGNSTLGLGWQAVRFRKYNVLLEMECGGCGVPPFSFDRERKGGSVCDDNEYRCRMSGDLLSPDHRNDSYVHEFNMLDS